MGVFWFITAILILISLALFIIPLWRESKYDDAGSRDELNKALYRDRLAELAEEEEEGLVADQNSMESELKKSLIDDVPQVENHSTSKINRLILLPGIIVILASSYGLYAKFGSYNEVEQWQSVAKRLPELSQRLMNDSTAPMSDQELADLTLALRTRLQSEPNDTQGWLLLGRLGMAARDMQTASGAMNKAYKLDPNNPDIQLGYGQTLIFSGDEGMMNQGRQMLMGVLQQDKTNLRALSLLAFDAFERQDYKSAVIYWKTMQALIGPDDSRSEMLNRSIQRAESQLNGGEGAENAIPVTITLGNNVKLPKQGVIIVSVHTADGSPMPIAAKRLSLHKMPLTINLSDNDSMIAENKLSSLSELIVRVRIDQDGNVMTKEGDWYGESPVVPFGHPVQVEINQQY
ncbi:c-type cytochrome biogenesis protein CcmI [Vibrio sp. SS-MA-C1-2]|uniref:c-type cytochrome biogenesis protein CcmI n=1 Tax=Vibrio sp. SS-MA-C1-2 TaxID=2908646 RepID=UPI001F2D2BE5|nr:c-type cytochrome biogenesis protein CcmI [Vibrio sp. SS-MA-C1-2]UJF18742.1 c-type cytochrome biogenesis protein CcmI [Vibrio sp. SS-MA-C1-2]